MNNNSNNDSNNNSNNNNNNNSNNNSNNYSNLDYMISQDEFLYLVNNIPGEVLLFLATTIVAVVVKNNPSKKDLSELFDCLDGLSVEVRDAMFNYIVKFFTVRSMDYKQNLWVNLDLDGDRSEYNNYLEDENISFNSILYRIDTLRSRYC